MRTLVLGASLNPDRYSNMAIESLQEHGYEVFGVGKVVGVTEGVQIAKELPEVKDIDTITLYLNPFNQKGYYSKILSLKPRRIIFNPGAENPEFEQVAKQNGIITENACTLVMLRSGQY
jgi:predicted CoA-binding protein